MKVQKFGILLSSALFMFAFQNCSKVEFAGGGEGTFYKIGSPDAPDITDGDGGIIDDGDDTITDDGGDDGGDTTVTDTDTDTDGDSGTINEVDPELVCNLEAQGNAELVELADGADVIGEKGNQHYSATNVDVVSAVNGNVNFYGSGGQINSINSHGNLVICGMHVASIVDFTRGNIVIVGGNVGNIDGFKGSLTLIGGEVLGTVTNSSGQIKSR
jgi:hypothetical protein